MNVIDSSSLAKYVNREPGWDAVSKKLEEGCVSIELATKEVANALFKRVMKKELDTKVASSVLQDLLELRPFVVEAQEDLYRDAFAIAVRENITVYDALFIQLARSKDTTLVTSDGKQARAAESVGVRTILIP